MRTAVDPHVHLHPAHDFDRALTAAERAAGALGGRLICCLVEMPGQDVFRRWRDAGEVAGRRVRVLDQGRLLELRKNDEGAAVFFAPGRQVATAERLEMLSICGEGDLPAGLSLAESAVAAREAGGLSVTPWGVGKWTGGRGQTVIESLRADPDLLAGDNGGRPVGWSSVPLDLARELGRTVLPGSDPLPLPGGASRLGSLGVWVDVPDLPGDGSSSSASEGEIGEGGWLAALRSALTGVGPAPATFGRHVGWPGLVLDQFRMRLGKSSASTASPPGDRAPEEGAA
ncbi:MAG: hypothetical protein AAF288_12970 [Planctomycetota bacterium]